MEKIKCIYAIKDKCSDKVIYIGQTKDFNQRVKSHKYENRCKIDKYITEQGSDNFEMYIVEKLLENLSKEEILNKEQFYINLYDTHKNGFNVFNSGNSAKNREFTKERQDYYKKYELENKEILKERRQKKYQENKEEILAKQRDKYQKNKEEILAKKKDKYYSNHEESLNYYSERRKTDTFINYQNNYYQENKEEIFRKHKNWCDKNKDKVKQYNNNWLLKNPDYYHNRYIKNKQEKEDGEIHNS